MAKAPTLPSITATHYSAAQLNAAFDAIEAAFGNTLSLDGSTPNSMGADLDLNGNDLLNVGLLSADDITIDGTNVSGVLERAEDAADRSETAYAQASLLEGPWLNNADAVAADTVLSYTAGTGKVVVNTGDYVRTREEGYSYIVLASAATDQHLVTAGGIKLKVVGSYVSPDHFSGDDDDKIAAAYAVVNSGDIRACQFESRTYNIVDKPPAITRSDAIINFNNARLRYTVDSGESTFITVGDPLGSVTSRVIFANGRFECLNDATSAYHAFVIDNASSIYIMDFDLSKVPGILKMGETANCPRIRIANGTGSFRADRNIHTWEIYRGTDFRVDSLQITSSQTLNSGKAIWRIAPLDGIDTLRISDVACWANGEDYGFDCDLSNGALTNLWVINTVIDRCRKANIRITATGTTTNWARHWSFIRCYFRSLGGKLLEVSNTSTKCLIEKVHFIGSALHYAGGRMADIPAPTSTGTTQEFSWEDCDINEDLIYVSDITKDTSAVIIFTTPHGLTVGQVVKIEGVNGMTGMNGLTPTITAVTDTTITVNVDSTGFGTYTYGGGVAASCDGAIQTAIEKCRVVSNTFGKRVTDAPTVTTVAVKTAANIINLQVIANTMPTALTPVSHFTYSGSGGSEITVLGNNAGIQEIAGNVRIGRPIITPSTAADELVVANSSTNAGISIQTPDTATGNIFFADTSSAAVGRITYDHSANSLALFTGGTSRVTVNSTGLATSQVKYGAAATLETSGTGTPEGVVTATVGSRFWREDGGVGTRLYFKTSGSGNTGWTAIL